MCISDYFYKSSSSHVRCFASLHVDGSPMIDQWKSNQGCINAKAVQLLGNPEALKDFMTDKSEEVKKATRNHLKTVVGLRRR